MTYYFTRSSRNSSHSCSSTFSLQNHRKGGSKLGNSNSVFEYKRKADIEFSIGLFLHAFLLTVKCSINNFMMMEQMCDVPSQLSGQTRLAFQCPYYQEKISYFHKHKNSSASSHIWLHFAACFSGCCDPQCSAHGEVTPLWQRANSSSLRVCCPGKSNYLMVL